MFWNPLQLSVEQLSWIFLIGSLLFASFLAVLLKPERQQVKAAVIAGLVLASLNFGLEYVAQRVNWYYTYGAVKILNVPLSLTGMWISLGICFCLIYSRLGNLKRPGLARGIYIFICGVGGAIYDARVASKIGFVRFEEIFKFHYILIVWVTLAGLTVLVYRLFLRE